MRKNIKSPCVNICATENGKCLGCYRTVEEIARWTTYSDAEKKEVLRKISERKIDDMDYYGFPG